MMCGVGARRRAWDPHFLNRRRVGGGTGMVVESFLEGGGGE
jgi:hypothetical protein